MEQRSPGHTVLDDKIYHKGMLDFKADIDAAWTSWIIINDPEAYDKQEAAARRWRITADALIRFGRAPRGEGPAAGCARTAIPQRRAELEQIAEVCNRVPAHAPRNFWEALQYYWFVHLGVTTELNPWDAFNPGRLDQHLYPVLSGRSWRRAR